MTGSKPCPRELLQRPAHERELEQHEVAAQVGEARARQPRAALHVDRVAGELEVVAAASPARGLADLAEDGVLVRRGRVGQVRAAARAPPAARSSTAASSLGERLDLGRRPRASARSPRRRPRPRAWPRRSPRSARVLLGAQRLERGRIAPAAPSSVEHAVEALRRRRRGAPARRARRRAQQLQIEHRARAGHGRRSREPARSHGAGGGVLALPCPRTWRGTPATSSASCPTTMFCGHDRAGEAAVADRVEHVVERSLRDVEVRAVDALAVGDLRRAEPCAPTMPSVWQPEQRSAKSSRRRAGPMRRTASATLETPSEPQAARTPAAATTSAASDEQDGDGP